MKLFKYSYWLYEYNFWVVCISSLLFISFEAKQYLISVLLPLSFFAIAYASRKKHSMNIFDMFIVLILVSDVISWAINDYRFKYVLIFRHIMGPISYMMVYFVGRNLSVEKSYKVFETSLLPALITSVVGIYCFFFPPSWYFSMMEDGALASLEALRLHSIFPSPYQLAYLDCFLLGYIFFRIFQYNDSLKKYKYHIVVFVITLIFCMMRAPMVGVALYLFFGLLLSSIVKGNFKKLINVLIGLIVMIGVMFVVLKNTNAQYVDYLAEKFEIVSDKNSTFVEDRYKLVEADESFFGDGAGRHNLWADDFNVGTSIRDGEYQKLMQEVGYFGQYIYITLIVLVILKSLKNYRYLLFEMSTMIFLLVSMIGACPLSTGDKSSFVFWLVMGRVASFRKTKLRDSKFKDFRSNQSIINSSLIKWFQ